MTQIYIVSTTDSQCASAQKMRNNVDTEEHCVNYGFHILKYGRMLRQKLQDLECVLRDIILIQRDDILSI